MIKRLLCLAVMITALSSLSFAQKGSWVKTPFGNPIVDTLKGSSGAHGVTVAPDGKIWVAVYQPYAADSVYVTDSAKYKPTKPVWVFNPDGSQASFSPIKGFVKDGKTVALGGFSNVGIQANKDGNIILSNGSSLYMFDYKTGAGLARFDNVPANGMNKPATDTLGNVFISHVLPGNPIKMLNNDLTFNANAVDTLAGYGRTLEVSKDGNTIFAARYTLRGILVYKRNSDFDPYVVVDTLAKGFSCESLGWNPRNGYLYAGSGSNGAKPQSDPSIPGLFWPQATVFTHYGIDIATRAVKDSISWVYPVADGIEMPRGIAFSPDGNTAYVCEFNNSSIPCLERFVFQTVGVEKEKAAVVNSYALSQNFPNPFNPSTEIKFSVAKAGFVTLKVYDMLGKEVATLVNENLTAGSYSTKFNASNLTSGIYIYQLNSNGNVLSHKMTLLK
ncbi:MAG: T9SS type A sorting domain-containing protein [Clostridiales bacterium]